MLKFIAVALAALYGLLLIFGDDARRPEQVTRQAADNNSRFSLASFVGTVPVTQTPESKPSLSDAEAVKLALQAGKELRSDRKPTPLRGTVVAVAPSAEVVPVSAESPDKLPEYWYVTGNRVNLRAGPGTGNAVVAQLTLGTQAEILGDPTSDWIEIRTTQGDAGWIFKTFLNARNPV